MYGGGGDCTTDGGRERSDPPLPTPVGGLPLCGVIGNLPHRHRAKVRAKVAFCKGGHKGAGFVILRRATVSACTRSGFVILRRDKPLGAPQQGARFAAILRDQYDKRTSQMLSWTRSVFI